MAVSLCAALCAWVNAGNAKKNAAVPATAVVNVLHFIERGPPGNGRVDNGCSPVSRRSKRQPRGQQGIGFRIGVYAGQSPAGAVGESRRRDRERAARQAPTPSF